jgi:hypothetical protein
MFTRFCPKNKKRVGLDQFRQPLPASRLAAGKACFFHPKPFLPMMNLLAAACLMTGLTTATSAHEPGDEPRAYPRSVATHATTLTQALARRIHCNEGQYLAIKKLHLHYLEERRQLVFEQSIANAPAAERDEQLAASQHGYEQALNGLLNPEQRLAYQQLRASFTAHRL